MQCTSSIDTDTCSVTVLSLMQLPGPITIVVVRCHRCTDMTAPVSHTPKNKCGKRRVDLRSNVSDVCS